MMIKEAVYIHKQVALFCLETGFFLPGFATLCACVCIVCGVNQYNVYINKLRCNHVSNPKRMDI